MCGRYFRRSDKQRIAEAFHLGVFEGPALGSSPFLLRRCLIPADGFYEWKRLDEKTKQPYAFALRSGEPFAFGGVWDAWKDPATEEWLQSFSINRNGSRPNAGNSEVLGLFPMARSR